jgi:uncharacterized membrane protein
MKRLVFALFLVTSFSLYPAPHDDLITAITESDYESFMKVYSDNTFSQESKAHFEDLANQMIKVRSDWMSMHASRPQMSKDLAIANILLISGWLVGFSSIWFSCIYAALEKQYELATIGVIFGVGTMASAAYYSFPRILAGWQKPKKLFADAVRIKDALAVTV